MTWNFVRWYIEALGRPSNRFCAHSAQFLYSLYFLRVQRVWGSVLSARMVQQHARCAQRALSVLFARAARKGECTEWAGSAHGAPKRALSVLFACAARKGEFTECGQRVRAAHKRTLSVLFARAARKGESTECARSAHTRLLPLPRVTDNGCVLVH